MSKQLSSLNVASALAGAVALASLAAPASAGTIEGMSACYGIAAAGQNSCANEAAGHACAGLSTEDFSGQDFRVVKDGTCEEQGGQLQAFNGTNTEAKANKM